VLLIGRRMIRLRRLICPRSGGGMAVANRTLERAESLARRF